jgi:molybdopterin adenylyltransferase
MGVREHKKKALEKLNIAIVTVSTTRSLKEDASGRWISRMARKEGHKIVSHDVVTDNCLLIQEKVLSLTGSEGPHAIIMNGGTGISGSDQTIEAVRPLFAKEITAFGVLFTQLSFETIYSAAMLARATAGIIARTIVFCLPGSLNACKLACKELIFPELGHMVKHLLD